MNTRRIIKLGAALCLAVIVAAGLASALLPPRNAGTQLDPVTPAQACEYYNEWFTAHPAFPDDPHYRLIAAPIPSPTP